MGQAAHHHSVAQVALASVGETDHRKLKWFAIHAWRGALQAQQSSSALHARMNGTAV